MAIVAGGILFSQAILYGPSLLGRKILLPLDALAQPGIYIPRSPGEPIVAAQNPAAADLVFLFEPARKFAHEEISHGRFPLWAPYEYGGVPFIWPKYSPFLLLESCFASPVILAWAQLAAALVAGFGMYVFCRRSLRVGFWPAAICGWCYPLTAFFALWQGFPTGLAVCWLPWVFFAVERTVAGSRSAGIGLSAVTFLTLVSGHIDVAGQVLLASAIYAVWCAWSSFRGGRTGRKPASMAAGLFFGWGLGLLLAAPHMLPLLEYAATGSRIAHRSTGVEERPPVGLSALPQAILPDIYGTTERGSAFIAPSSEANLPESASAAYAGILAALLAAPLAWCRRSRRAENAFWAILAFFGLSWSLNVPGLVAFLRLPPLNMMSQNRLVFLTAFAVLCLAAIGLENLREGEARRRGWFWLPALLLGGLGAWCLHRCLVLPGPIASADAFAAFHSAGPAHAAAAPDLRQVQAWFIRHFAVTAGFCALGFAGWLALGFGRSARPALFPLLGALLVADLLWFDYGRSAQCDPALYFPPVSALAEIHRASPGRVIGSLPASLGIMVGLNQICGYDGIDPARMVDLLKTAAAPQSKIFPYAQVQFFVPRAVFSSPSTIRLPPVLDLLNVRYVILRGGPVSYLHPAFQTGDYMVMINPGALSRVSVPTSVAVAADPGAELTALASPGFNPREVALVESPVALPARCRGEARITRETPTDVAIATHMETPGLVVLADNWDKGWRAFYDGKPVPVLRADYAVRGVVVPAGDGRLEFVYRPASLVLGLGLAGIAALALLSWLVAARRRRGFGPSGHL